MAAMSWISPHSPLATQITFIPQRCDARKRRTDHHCQRLRAEEDFVLDRGRAGSYTPPHGSKRADSKRPANLRRLAPACRGGAARWPEKDRGSEGPHLLGNRTADQGAPDDSQGPRQIWSTGRPPVGRGFGRQFARVIPLRSVRPRVPDSDRPVTIQLGALSRVASGGEQSAAPADRSSSRPQWLDFRRARRPIKKAFGTTKQAK
jgi:hypothetical protein